MARALLGCQVRNCGGGVAWVQSPGSLHGALQLRAGIRIFSQGYFMVWPRQVYRKLVFPGPDVMGSCRNCRKLSDAPLMKLSAIRVRLEKPSP